MEKICYRCYCSLDSCIGPIPEYPPDRPIVTEFVGPADCDACKAKAAQLEAARQRCEDGNAQTVLDFLSMAATIDRPQEWKQRILSHLLPSN